MVEFVTADVTVVAVEFTSDVTAAAVVVRFQLQPFTEILAFGIGGFTTWAPIPIQNMNASEENKPAYAPYKENTM